MASAASDREDQLRGEVRRAEDRMRAAETAASEAASQSGDSTKPLLRQIEAMAAAAVRHTACAALWVIQFLASELSSIHI